VVYGPVNSQQPIKLNTKPMSSLPETRQEYQDTYPGPNYVDIRDYGIVDTYHPTADRINRGDRIEVWKPGSKYCHSGGLVEEVSGNKVKVRHYIGGTLEHSKWHNVSDVLVVWSIGGWDAAMAKFRAFDAAMNNLAQRR